MPIDTPIKYKPSSICGVIIPKNKNTMIPFVSVDDFTGTDQSRINQAIAAITPTGGTIIFPKRTYTIDHFTLDSNMTVVGNGSTITRTSDLNAPFIDVAQQAKNVTIGGLIFNGNKTTQNANNDGAIRCVLNQHVTITDCIFIDILRVAIVIDQCSRIQIGNVSFDNGGDPGKERIGNSIAITSSKDVTVENLSAIVFYGEGTSVESSQGIVFRNHTYTRGNIPSLQSYNAITFTQSSDFVIEDIEASYMGSVGIELNICDRFKLSNLNLHHNGLYNLMISVSVPNSTDEIPSTYGEVSNVISADAGGFAGVNIIGSHHISFNNITDNKRARFAAAVTGIPSTNIEVSNSTFNQLEISGSKDIRMVNTTFVTPLISSSTYSLITAQKKFETYFQADLNHNQSINVNVPVTASGGTTFFHGILEVDNTFTPSASLQFTSRVVHIKLIWDQLYRNTVSQMVGTIARDFTIGGGNNTLIITNTSGVATTLRGRLTGTVDMY